MNAAERYRAKAAELTELLKAASSPAEIREFRDRAQSYVTLAENDEWLADNLEKTNSPGAADDWYADIIPARHRTNAPESVGVAGATSDVQFPTKIQQLIDDAGCQGGMLQTATLRGQFARFLQKHKDDDFS
jgi:hypothetical protein